MAKVVVDNTSPKARQRQLEAQVQVAFAKAANATLTFLAGKANGNMIKAMQEFIAIHEAAEEESIDPKGIAIRIPKLNRVTDNDEDEHINAILRGSLRMVAAMLKMNAKVPVDNAAGRKFTKAEKRDYDKALREIAQGIVLQNERMSSR